MEILNITPFNHARFFNIEDLEALLPVLLTITSKTHGQANGLKAQIDYFKAQPGKADALAQQYNELIQKWSEKMRRLGGIPTGLFQVKFSKNAHGGYFLWSFPKDSFEEF